jgi:hypothetical protein
MVYFVINQINETNQINEKPHGREPKRTRDGGSPSRREAPMEDGREEERKKYK